MVRRWCEGCGEVARGDERPLVSPCDCYKKEEDLGRWHVECLKKMLESRDVQDGATCLRCRQKLRLRFRMQLTWHTLCSAASLSSLFELAVLVFSVAAVAAVVVTLPWQQLHPGGGDVAALVLVSLLMLVMLFFTLRKVAARLRFANSTASQSA